MLSPGGEERSPRWIWTPARWGADARLVSRVGADDLGPGPAGVLRLIASGRWAARGPAGVSPPLAEFLPGTPHRPNRFRAAWAAVVSNAPGAPAARPFST